VFFQQNILVRWALVDFKDSLEFFKFRNYPKLHFWGNVVVEIQLDDFICIFFFKTGRLSWVENCQLDISCETK